MNIQLNTRLYRLSIVLVFILLLSVSTTNAQRSYGSKFFLGGNLGLQFGSVTLIDVSPLVGYRLTEQIDIGVGATYKYYNNKDYLLYYNQYYGVESNIYGGSIFGRYHINENFFIHAEFEYLSYNFNDYIVYPTSLYKTNKSIEIESIFVGGGYRQEVGGNLYMTAMLLYNLNETRYSPYSNPVIRIGFTYGL